MSISLTLSRRAGYVPTRAVASIDARAGITQALRLAGQFGILWLVLTAGSLVSNTLALPLPGNLAGMLLLLALLWAGVIRLEWIADLAAILVRHLMLFFIPLAVGLMVWQNLFASSGLVIGVSLAGSAVVGMLAAGVAAQRMARRGGESGAA